MSNFEERRQRPRIQNASQEQFRNNKPTWLYSKHSENELFTLVVDLSDTGCCFMIPKDFQVDSHKLTFSLHEMDDSIISEAEVLFTVVWIDEHYSHDEQKYGVEFSKSSSASEIIQESINYLETGKENLIRCRVKVKEERSFF